jgi:cell division protein FtsB
MSQFYRRKDLIIIILIFAVALTSIYYWQHGQTSNINKQNSKLRQQNNSLEKSNADLKKQSSNLSDQLNKANQSISNLSQSNSFVSGAGCQTQQLALAEEKNYGGAAGSTAELFSYQNTSSTPCTIKGYAGFLALDSSGYVMPNGSIQTGTVISSKAPYQITLAPSAKSYFAIMWHMHDAVGTENGCVKPSVILSTPPGNLLPLTIATGDLNYMCGGLTASAIGNLGDFQ